MSHFSTGSLCLHSELPLDGRHFCGICRSAHLHGPCGVFIGNDAEITYRNASCLISSTTARDMVPPIVIPTLNPRESSSNSAAASASTLARKASSESLAKCSLRQCKNTDARAELLSCSYKDCEKRIHKPCFMAFLVKNQLPPLPDDKFCCGVKAHHSGVLNNSSLNVTEKTRWDADGPNGPDTEPNSMSVLLHWWTTEGNYSKYRGGKDQTGKTKEAY